MTREEAIKFLSNTKVYVNGKSKEIQEKLFSLGFQWTSADKQVLYTEQPFLFIWMDKDMSYDNDMEHFAKKEFREITANDILNIVIDEPKYRPFKNADECWQEMQKHPPFGWVFDVSFYNTQICRVRKDGVNLFNEYISYSDAVGNKILRFVDGAPFGIKIEEEES